MDNRTQLQRSEKMKMNKKTGMLLLCTLILAAIPVMLDNVTSNDEKAESSKVVFRVS
jgi:hypothetical protein